MAYTNTKNNPACTKSVRVFRTLKLQHGDYREEEKEERKRRTPDQSVDCSDDLSGVDELTVG